MWAAAILGAAMGLAQGSDLHAVLLWPNGAPGTAADHTDERVRVSDAGEHILTNIHAPSITPCLPAPTTAKSAAVVVIPGGGHVELWMDHEGYNVASYLSARGVAAFILKYRLARAAQSSYTVEGSELADVQRAIRLVRSRASSWRIDPQRVGVLGFSAGGELVLRAATAYDAGQAEATDPIDRQSSRPDFQAALYPAIPQNLKFSHDTPPAFLLAGTDDRPAISAGLASLYLSLRDAGVPAELHLYNGVGHGFGLRATTMGPVADWPQVLVAWLSQRGITSPTESSLRPAQTIGRCQEVP